MTAVSLWGPVAAAMAAIFVVSGVPGDSLPSNVPATPGHAVAYAALALLVVRALAGGLPRRIGIGTMVLAMAITVGYGVTDEFHQRFVPGRFADVNDLFTDAMGAAVGTAGCWAWGILWSRSGRI